MKTKLKHGIAAAALAVGSLVTSLAVAGGANAIPVGGTGGGPPQQLLDQQIKTWTANECMDNDTDRAFTLQIYGCHGATAQLWDVIEGADPNHPNAVTFNSMSDRRLCVGAIGGQVHTLEACGTNDPSQEWQVFQQGTGRFPGTWQIFQNVFTGQCLGVPNTANHTLLTVSACSTVTDLQKFVVQQG